MKKFNVEFKFVCATLIDGIDGGVYLPLGMEEGRKVLSVTAKISLEKMPPTGEYVTLLDGTQLSEVFEGEAGEIFDALEDVRNAFTFEVKRHRGRIEKTPKGTTYYSHAIWFALICEQGNMRLEDAISESSLVLSQLVRFGVMDKIR